MTLTARTATIAGRRLSFFDAGKGPTLGLLHGIGSSGESFESLIDLLAGKYRIVAWNAPGYGTSEPLANKTPSSSEYAEVAAGLLGEVAPGPFFLLGHSLGAIVAGRLAVTHPARVRKLVLANAAGGYGGAPAEVRAKRLQERISHMDDLGPAKLAETRSRALLGPDASDAAVEKVKVVQRKLNPDAYKQAAYMLAHGDLLGDAARITVPTLVMCGSADQVTPEAGNRKIADAIKGARYRSLPNLGHISYVEDPEMFASVLTDFLAAPA
jgi:pimeloyl-ACP methyl ester carboxylesterase